MLCDHIDLQSFSKEYNGYYGEYEYLRQRALPFYILESRYISQHIPLRYLQAISGSLHFHQISYLLLCSFCPPILIWRRNKMLYKHEVFHEVLFRKFYNVKNIISPGHSGISQDCFFCSVCSFRRLFEVLESECFVYISFCRVNILLVLVLILDPIPLPWCRFLSFLPHIESPRQALHSDHVSQDNQAPSMKQFYILSFFCIYIPLHGNQL